MSTRWNCLAEAILTSTHILCFEQKYEKYRNFYVKNFTFLAVKLLVYLNRHVFIMQITFLVIVGGIILL